MSDHLIAEAHRHAMALPTTHPTHADIAWYVREVSELRAEVKESKERERVAIASWDEERQRALREGGRVVELRAEVERLGRSEREARGSERDVRQILDTYAGVEARAESAEREVERLKADGAASAFVAMSCRASHAETELATERKANRDLAEVISGQDKELTAERARLDWLGAHGFLLDEITHGANKPHPDDYWICTDGEISGRGTTPRAAIDSAMKEGA